MAARKTHCDKCGTERRFYPKGKYLAGLCPKCTSERKALWALEKGNKLRKAKYDPAINRVGQLKVKYGMTLEQYVDLLASQGGTCAACRRPASIFPRNLCVDHDHSCCPGQSSCGECVRGLLCAGCNSALGHISDSFDTALSLAKYLQEHGDIV